MTNFEDLFTEYGFTNPVMGKVKPLPRLKVTTSSILQQKIPVTIDEPEFVEIPVEEVPKIDEEEIDEPKKEVKVDTDLLKIDIEDLLKSEGITSVNGKPIKFGNKNLRPQNASYGAKNSNHKKRDPHTGNAMARDISIIGGTTKDYADFRSILLSNPRVVQYMTTKGWGIINEITPAILARTNGTGNHFHFGPDTWAKRTWKAWLNNPNLSITTAV